MQAALLDNSQFAEICAVWVTRKHTRLADLLIERRLLTNEECQEVERLVQRNIKKHAGSVRASLANLADAGVRRTLSHIEDNDVQKSLAELPSESHALLSTINYKPSTRDRYTFTRLHAKGGIGQVWLARDAELSREVALKELLPERAADPASWRRFLDEAQITGQLEHPSIVPVYELVRPGEGQKAFYTMRFVRGRTLTEAVRRFHKKLAKGKGKFLDQLTLLNAFVSVCNAVSFAHSRGVVHRDLKGQNVVLGDFGEVILLDWGLAKLLDQAEENSELPQVIVEHDRTAQRDSTRPGAWHPGVHGAEQAKGRLDSIDERTDVYGLGAMLYEILSGQAPFHGSDTEEVLRQVREEEPAAPRQFVPRVAPGLEAICAKAMNKRSKDRYASASDLANDVQHWLADEPVTAYREALHWRMARWSRRHPTRVTAAALVLFAVLAGGIWFKLDRITRAAAVAQQAAKTEGQVLATLQDVEQLVNHARLDNARAAVDRAQDQLAGGSTELQNRIRQARDDLNMVLRLENVLLLETFTAGKFENVAANAAYALAFQQYQVNLDELKPPEAAEKIKASAIREQLVTALDDWIYVKPRADTTGRERLLTVVRLADSDSWRQRLRDPVMHKDRACAGRIGQASTGLETTAHNTRPLGEVPRPGERLAGRGGSASSCPAPVSFRLLG